MPKTETPFVVRASATNTQLATAPCKVLSLRIIATTAGTVTLFDNTAASGVSVFGTIQCPLGVTVIPIAPSGVTLKNGLFATFATFVGTVHVGVAKN